MEIVLMARRTLFLAGVLTLGLLLVAPPQHVDAADAEGAKALLAEMAASLKAKDASAFAEQAKRAVEMHNGLEDKALRGKLQKELGSGLKNKHLKGVHAEIITALGSLNDSKGAYKQLKRFMPSPKLEEITDRQRAVLTAVDGLAPSGAIKDLYALAEKAKNHDAAALAIGALGSFKTSKKRAAILETLVKLIARFMPPRNQTVGKATRERWAVLGPALGRACNEISGQKVRDPTEWLELWRDNKKKPANLFVNDG